MEAQVTSTPAHLKPSPLGTKEYWDKLYEIEISNHAANPSDLGTIWFDDSSAEDKVLAFLHSPYLSLDRERTSFLDIGTGNGHFLFRLREKFQEEEDDGDEHEQNDDDSHGEKGGQNPGSHTVRKGIFSGRIVGTDYSLKSIEFATRVAAARDPPVRPPIEFVHYDIMATAPAPAPALKTHHPLLTPPNTAGFDVVLDKGTFDAISLSDQALDDGAGGKRLCEGYKARILPLVREGGIFVITSCNWTEAELRGWFEDGGASASADVGAGGGGEGVEETNREGDVEMGFVFETGLKYRSFRFGGKEGQSISSVCFRKRRFGS